MDSKIINKKPLSRAEVSEILKSPDRKERGAIQQKTYDFTKKFSKITPAQNQKLLDKLKELGITRMTEEHLVTIADLLPKDVAELRTVFAGSKTTIKPEDLDKIQAIVKEFSK